MEKTSEGKVGALISILVDSGIEGGVLLQKIKSGSSYMSLFLDKDEIMPVINGLLKLQSRKVWTLLKSKNYLTLSNK